MKEFAVTKEQVGRRTEPIEHANPYYSVELSINELEIAYQFKIWNTESTPMCVLVKEDSNILPRLKVGDWRQRFYISPRMIRADSGVII